MVERKRPARLPVRPERKVRRRRRPPPEGKLEMVVTYLEMTERPTFPPPPHPGEKIALLRAEAPPISFYRYLYNTVGEQWLWYERRRMSDDSLRAVIHHPEVEIFVLYVRGVPAGYVELDGRVEGEFELAYVGLIPEFIGRGLGRFLLYWAVDKAWDRSPRRVWVHTCNFDHPRAIATYQRAGFRPYKQETLIIDDPREDGTLPRDS